jgi:hypothetical protein
MMVTDEFLAVVALGLAWGSFITAGFGLVWRSVSMAVAGFLAGATFLLSAIRLVVG